MPVLMVLLVAKNPGLALLPVLSGFVTNQIALVSQIVYPANYGVTLSDNEHIEK